jgi:hypothetical protein
MNAKVLKSIFFVTILLTSKVGLALNIHYCGGQIAEISMAWEAEGCQMSYPLDQQQGFEVKKSHCCDNEIVFIQNNTPQKVFDFSYDLIFPISLETQQNFFLFKKFHLQKTITLSFSCFTPKSKIFLLNSAFVFYG